MRKYVYLCAFILLAHVSRAQINQTTVYSKIYFEANQAQFEKLRTLIVFEHLAKSDKGFVGDFDQDERSILVSNASNVKILAEDVSKFYEQRAANDLKKAAKKKRTGGVPANYHGGSMGGFMTLSQMQQNLDSMNLLYPNLISAKQQIGLTIENRPIFVYKISDNYAVTEPQEHRTLFTALHHAREPQSAAQLIYFMWYLLENYGASDSVVKHLVDDRELYFIPVLNPDGYVYNETINPNGGGMWRKNRKVNGGGTFGVDLNRNYAKYWGFDNAGSSPNPSSDTYRGTAGFSENETQIARDFTILKQPKVVLNYHSYGDWFIYPWGYQNLTCADDTTFQVVADILTKENMYVSGNCWQTLNYLSNGSSDDWHYGDQVAKPKIFAITPEVGSAADGFWPSPLEIIPLCQENLYQNIMASWMSGPYIEHIREGLHSFPSTNINLQYKFKNYGLDTCLQLKSWFVSNNPWIQTNTDTIVLSNLITHQMGSGNLAITMQNTTPNNTLVSGRLYTKYNNFIYSDTSSFIVGNSVGIHTISDQGIISVSPNPGTGTYKVTFSSEVQLLNCTVFDATGKAVLQIPFVKGKVLTIDLSRFSNGIYFLELQQQQESQRFKLIKY
ncbi:MAG: T9SS type A sorting domain-containing protein [Bacteroidetes bacterium]|nr:T9SS type A sorting domain-containing protein [Bacteroidota bacterium]